MVKIVWTEISVHDLKEIYDYIAEDSSKYAYLTTVKIFERTQELKENLYSGRIVPEINNKKIRELIEGNYRIIYRIETEGIIQILRIYHSARLLKKKSIKS